jgi:putative ABC transport system substrate-binding protein
MLGILQCSRKSAVITVVVSTLILVHVAEAQTKKIPAIGWLSVRHGPTINPHFVRGLRELGWFPGRNIAFEARFAKERYDQLPKLAAELVDLKVDVIVVASSSAIPAAKNATHKIPIVMVVVSDPVALGYVASLARPRGNITGLTNDLGPIDSKRLQLLKEAVRSVSHVAVLGPTISVDWKTLEAVSRSSGVQLERLPFNHSDELERLFETAPSKWVNGLMVRPSPRTNRHRSKIIEFASRSRLPAIYPLTSYVTDGGLMSYGPNLPVMPKRAAYYVDRILKGAKPSDLPVERPMAAEFAINLKAAKEIGLSIPPEVLQRAGRVIR